MDNNLSFVESFYDNKCVLVTGFTGFIGKVFVEKLLRSTNVKKIYVLVRGKDGKNSCQRVKEIVTSQPFLFCKKTQQNIHKVIGLSGNVTEENLGLNCTDRYTVVSDVSIVIHAAAAVRFNTSFKTSFHENVVGTNNVLNLCPSLVKLESLVYVSTAYSFCQHLDIKETVYPVKINGADFISLYKQLKDDTMNSIFFDVREERPSSYTLTKAIAENLVTEKRGSMTTSIVRPSIVCHSMKEPIPGWIDNLNGISGISSAASIGLIQVYDFDYYGTADLFPVDYVANSLIVIAAYAATYAKTKCKVYNLTSGSINPIIWGSFFEKARELILEKPSIKTIRPLPEVSERKKGIFYYQLQVFFLHILFSYIFDFFSFVFGYEKFLVKSYKKLSTAIDLFDYYAHRSWKFENNNYIKVIESLNQNEKRIFECDIISLDWNIYINNYVNGTRKFILRENFSNIPQAKKRYRTLTTMFNLTYYAFLGLFFAVLYYIISIAYAK